MTRKLMCLLLCLALVGLAPRYTLAEGMPGSPIEKPAPDPNDKGCADPAWPYYYYRHPVIFQETSNTGELRFVGFAYMDACKQSGQGVRGGTASSLMELDGVWRADILQIWSQMTVVAALNEALPGIEHPGDNAFRWPVPAFPIHGLRYADFYLPSAETICRYRADDVDLVCPGVPPSFGQTILADAGYIRIRDRYGTYRWTPGPDAQIMAAWFKSAIPTMGPGNPSENFYARHWADDMHTNHGDGGLIRVILNPVDLVLHSVPETTTLTGDAKAIIPVAIGNPSTRNSLKTTVGWRIAGEAYWRPVEGWRPQGEQDWRPYTELIPLSAQESSYIEVLITGGQDGQMLQLMANERKAIPEAGLNEGAFYDAYKNNIGQTKLEDGALDLAVTRLEILPAQASCDPSGSYLVRWVITNSSNRTVTARRQVIQAPGKAEPNNLRIGVRSFPPGETTEESTIPIIHCGDTVTYRVEINGDRAVTETSYANNTLSRSITIEAYVPREINARQGAGGGVIIVPPDCDRNPDNASDYPCLNYPGLKMPR